MLSKEFTITHKNGSNFFASIQKSPVNGVVYITVQDAPQRQKTISCSLTQETYGDKLYPFSTFTSFFSPANDNPFVDGNADFYKELQLYQSPDRPLSPAILPSTLPVTMIVQSVALNKTIQKRIDEIFTESSFQTIHGACDIFLDIFVQNNVDYDTLGNPLVEFLHYAYMDFKQPLEKQAFIQDIRQRFENTREEPVTLSDPRHFSVIASPTFPALAVQALTSNAAIRKQLDQLLQGVTPSDISSAYNRFSGIIHQADIDYDAELPLVMLLHGSYIQLLTSVEQLTFVTELAGRAGYQAVSSVSSPARGSNSSNNTRPRSGVGVIPTGDEDISPQIRRNSLRHTPLQNRHTLDRLSGHQNVTNGKMLSRDRLVDLIMNELLVSLQENHQTVHSDTDYKDTAFANEAQVRQMVTTTVGMFLKKDKDFVNNIPHDFTQQLADSCKSAFRVSKEESSTTIYLQDEALFKKNLYTVLQQQLFSISTSSFVELDK